MSSIKRAADREVDRVGRVVAMVSRWSAPAHNPGFQGDQRGDAVADRVVKPGIEQALRVDRSDRGELLDLRVVEDRGEECGVADLAKETRARGVLTDDDLVEGNRRLAEERLSG